MRLTVAALVCLTCAVACDRPTKLTPEQAEQVEAARGATVMTTEKLLGRALSDSEKACIHVDFKDGRAVGSISAPLSDLLKRRQAELRDQAMQPK